MVTLLDKQSQQFRRNHEVPMKKISVLLADDHTVVRQGLRVLLEVEADIQVVGEAETGRQAVQMVK